MCASQRLGLGIILLLSLFCLIEIADINEVARWIMYVLSIFGLLILYANYNPELLEENNGKDS